MTIFDFDYNTNNKTLSFSTGGGGETISIDMYSSWISYESGVEDLGATTMTHHTYTVHPLDPTGNPVQITLSIIEGDPTVTVSMGDNGIGIDETMSAFLADTLRKTLTKFQAKQTGREVSSLQRLPVSSNAASVIASHLTGKSGSVPMQINRLKRNAGYEGPLRMTKTEAKAARGGRQTRRKRV